jgi:hypothetical protein
VNNIVFRKKLPTPCMWILLHSRRPEAKNPPPKSNNWKVEKRTSCSRQIFKSFPRRVRDPPTRHIHPTATRSYSTSIIPYATLVHITVSIRWNLIFMFALGLKISTRPNGRVRALQWNYRWHVYFSQWVLHTCTFPPCREFLSFSLVRPVCCQSKRMNALDTLTFPSNPDSTILLKVVEYLPICNTHYLPILWRIIPSSSRRQIIRIYLHKFFSGIIPETPLSPVMWRGLTNNKWWMT